MAGLSSVKWFHQVGYRALSHRFLDWGVDTCTLPGGEFVRLQCQGVSGRYPEGFDNPAGRPPGSVMTVEMVLAGSPVTVLNGGPAFTINPSISFFVHTETRQDTDRTFAALADGGSVMMPLQAYPWSERYGWVQDRFGVSWQVMLGRRGDVRDTIVPCLMFCGEQHGRAEEAMGLYTGVFEDAGIRDVSRYEG